MKKVCVILTLFLTVVSLTSSTAFALQLVTETRIESTTGSPVKKDLSFVGQGFEGFAPVIINISPIQSIFPLLGQKIPEDSKTQEISSNILKSDKPRSRVEIL